MDWSPNRRTFLRAATLGGITAVTGCVGSKAAQPNDEQPTTTQAGTKPAEMSLHEWVASANTPQGWTDHRDESSVSIGVGGHDLPYAFQPALTRVARGTTVTWKWSGYGGNHNIVAVDDAFDSGDPVSEEGHTFEHTFTETGTHRYVSEPRQDSGMKGIIAVEEAPTSGYPEVDRWLAPVNSYDGTVVTDTTTVTVGASSADSPRFGPLVLKVSEGTTVQWRWTGDGDGHNIAFKSADIELQALKREPGIHFEHTFDATGTYRYYCSPHRAIGGKGAIIVE